MIEEVLRNTQVRLNSNFIENSLQGMLQLSLQSLAGDGSQVRLEHFLPPTGTHGRPSKNRIGLKGYSRADIIISSGSTASLVELEWARVVRGSESPEAGESAEDLLVRTTLTQEKRQWLVRQKLVTAAAALPKKKGAESIELTLGALARLAASQASENARRLAHQEPALRIVHALGAAAAGRRAVVVADESVRREPNPRAVERAP